MISLISKEYKCQHAQHACHSGPGKAKDDEKDKALSVVPGKARESHENPTGFAGTVETKVIIRTNALNLLSKKKTHPKRLALLMLL